MSCNVFNAIRAASQTVLVVFDGNPGGIVSIQASAKEKMATCIVVAGGEKRVGISHEGGHADPNDGRAEAMRRYRKFRSFESICSSMALTSSTRA